MVDPVEEVSGIALERGLPLHVDSCIGGFMLPWSAYYSSCGRGDLTIFVLLHSSEQG
jgi:glutamate/tyrosine decarboxylase-like PLP-dependent enzyme